jgi:hypothetical protein
MKTELILADMAIRQDSEGRYCLNDLHKAAGNEPHKAPNQWLRNQQIQELIRELTANLQLAQSKSNELSTNMCLAPIVSLKGGKTPGVYAVKDLVYAYAMWISAEFHLHVIRAYDALVTKTKTPEQLYRDLANELRLALPYLNITDRAVLLSHNTGIRNFSGETREQCRYFRKMDGYGLPGIIAIDRKPYKVLFDWLTQQRDYSDEITDSVYAALRAHCRGYKGMLHIGHTKKLDAFQIKANFEEITGIKSLEEAKNLAADMAKIVSGLLAEKSNFNFSALENRVGINHVQ